VSAPRKPVETTPGMEPLAVLPVFLRLQGRRGVLAGDGDGAVWKAKLLAAAGAAVEVFAPQPSQDMRQAPAEIAAGSIVVHDRAWRAKDLEGAAFGIAALEDEAGCAAFVAAARAQGAIVNAVDRPHLCDVQFGAIVNRSPLVVGISTDGAAPVFAQGIRSRIEALLPRGFAHWVEAAKGWREIVAMSFARLGERRVFWERFADRALAEPGRAPTDRDLADLFAAARDGSGERGSVALVGAGPGDPELLTLKAVRALRSADIILYDDLVAPEILDYARREARTLLVGKTGHGPSCRQDEINALMVKFAREGRRLVRLKGGDPLIFSRAAEELRACTEAGIPVEIVPGITAAQGAAARLGLPLTHRSTARRLQFVAGHDMRGEAPDDLNWPALADPSATTAIYMPRRTLARILATAIERGLPASTPAVAIINATRSGERIIEGAVSALDELTVAADVKGPVLVLVGDAVAQSRSRRTRLAHRSEARNSDVLSLKL
jgi:uroporphyrin-III C-methyltransferase / precorrin-2 dehydrogenase / sirohydrochlorin ferrochelatase